MLRPERTGADSKRLQRSVGRMPERPDARLGGRSTRWLDRRPKTTHRGCEL